MNQSWSVIIFCYNEEDTIGNVIEKSNEFLTKNKISESEIIVVDDGSTDGSEKIIRSCLLKFNKINYIRLPKNMGIGKALSTGYENSRNENVVAIPGDGQFDINELKPFINFPEKSYISFYRGGFTRYSNYRKIISRTNKFFNKLFLYLDAKDVNWVKAYKTGSLKQMNLKLESSLIGSEICAKLNLMNYSIIESPSVYHIRAGGKSRGASIKTLSQAGKDLIKLASTVRNFKKKLK
ncbi:MAG: glycosyltransferase family 2 protein [Ignavibacteria bacterium]